MSLINKILESDIFQQKPPVLIDIGASGKIHRQWKSIAKYSVCIAFDADDREFGYITKESSGFKKLYIYNCIVSDQETTESDFYLTKSPYCSSLLKPDSDALKVWSFSEKFGVEKVVKLKTRSLNAVLKDLGLQYVDWFKTDSQGTDLRLFKSLPEDIRRNVISAEFEPGIIDSYMGEDKLYEILRFMEAERFWLSDITVKGTPRINIDLLRKISNDTTVQKLLDFSLKKSPGWTELLYLNNMEGKTETRDMLLAWVFAIISNQYGFALEILDKPVLIKNMFYKEMYDFTMSRIKTSLLSFRFLPAVFHKISSLFN